MTPRDFNPGAIAASGCLTWSDSACGPRRRHEPEQTELVFGLDPLILDKCMVVDNQPVSPRLEGAARFQIQSYGMRSAPAVQLASLRFLSLSRHTSPALEIPVLPWHLRTNADEIHGLSRQEVTDRIVYPLPSLPSVFTFAAHPYLVTTTHQLIVPVRSYATFQTLDSGYRSPTRKPPKRVHCHAVKVPREKATSSTPP